MELVRASKKSCDLVSTDGKILVEVKSIKENFWNMGPITDGGHRLARQSLVGGPRYEVHLIRFLEDDRVFEHYVMPAEAVLKYTSKAVQWAFEDSPRFNLAISRLIVGKKRLGRK